MKKLYSFPSLLKYLYCFSFLICSFSAVAAPGENCSEAVVIQTGAQSMPSHTSSTYWYRFTMPNNGKLRIQTQEVFYGGFSIYKGSCGSETYLNAGRDLLEIPGLLAGESILIQFSTQGTYFTDWTLAVKENEAGDLCTLPQAPLSGTNTISGKATHETWYEFTVPFTGSLSMSTTSPYVLQVSDKCTNPTIYQSNEQITIPNAAAGSKYLIRLVHGTNTPSWEFNYTNESAGTECINPVMAQEGANTMNSATVWYEFTMPRDGKLHLTKPNNQVAEVYTSCSNSYIARASTGTQLAVPGRKAGEKLYIKLNTTSVPINWNLEVKDDEEGDSCIKPITASVGNTTPAHFSDFLWYKLDVTDQKTIELNFNGSRRRVELWSECNETGLDQTATGSFIHFNGLIPNHTYYLKITTGGYTFDWTLNLLDEIPLGESCETAQLITATWLTEGSANHTMYYWYKFVIQNEKRLFVEHRINGDRNIEAYADCGGTLLQSSNNSELSIPGLKVGDEVYIRVYNEGWYTNNILLYETPNLTGEHCTTAHKAEVGSNTVPAHELKYYWYSYTMPADGNLQVNEPTGNRQISAVNSCSETTLNVSGKGKLTLKGLKKGEIIYFKFDTGQQQFGWTLKTVDPTEGDNCSLAKAVEVGSHSLDPFAKESWFSFQMPKEGKLTVSTEADISLSLFSTCDTEAIISGKTSVFNTNLSQDETVYIKVEHNFKTASVTIDVQDFAEGDICTFATRASEGTNQALHAFSWQYFIMPGQGDVEISTTNQSSLKDQLKVYSSCSSSDSLPLNYYSSTGSEVRVEQLSKGDTLFIHWNRKGATAGFEWKAKIRTPTAQNYYWIGNGGNWSDLNHWATTSGGTTLHQELPSYEDTVIFDQQSFHANQEKVVKLDVMATAATLTTQECESSVFIQGTNSLRIEKSLLLDGVERIYILVPVKLHNKGNDEMILQQGTSYIQAGMFSGGRLHISGRGTFDEFSIKKEEKEKPLFLSLNGYVNIKRLITQNTTASDTILFDEASLDLDNLKAHSPISLAEKGESEILFGAFPATLSGESLSFPVPVVLPGNSSLEIIGSHTFQNIEFHSSNTLTLEAGSIQKVENIVAFGSAETNLIQSSAEGVQAFFEKKEGRLNVYNVTLKDNGAMGGALFYAYKSMAKGLVTGWIGFKEAQEISFDSFEEVNLGVGSLELKATSTSGLAVNFEVIEGPAHIENQVLFFDGTGIVKVKATQGGDAVYDPAEAVEHSFCITPEQPTISISEGLTEKKEAVLSSNYPEGNQWYLNGEAIEGANAQTYEPGNAAGSYSLQVSLNGCSSKLSERVTITGFHDKIAIRKLHAYPNPTSGTVWVEFSSSQKAGNIKATLYTLEGQLIQAGISESISPSEWKVRFETSQLATGLYFIMINDGKQIFRTRIQKQ